MKLAFVDTETTGLDPDRQRTRKYRRCQTCKRAQDGSRRAAKRAAAAALAAITAGACWPTPRRAPAPPPVTTTTATTTSTTILAAPVPAPPPEDDPAGGAVNQVLACIRQWETGGGVPGRADYTSRSGPHGGAYQFDQGTWESVGGTGRPEDASPAEQDARAARLLAERGLQPWPTPSRKCA